MKAPAGKVREPNPEGSYPVNARKVIDLGTQDPFDAEKGKPTRQFQVVFENVANPEELTEEGERFTTPKRYTFSSHEKSNMYRDWKGMGVKDVASFDIEDIVGKVGMASFENKKSAKTGKEYAVIKSITAMPAGLKTVKPKEPITTFIMDPDKPFDQVGFDSLWDEIKKTIAKSPEYAKLQKAAIQKDKDKKDAKATKGKKK
jgi:hypothetical protein